MTSFQELQNDNAAEVRTLNKECPLTTNGHSHFEWVISHSGKVVYSRCYCGETLHSELVKEQPR